MLDFKKEAGTVGRDGLRQPIDAHDETAARALAGEVACFKNSITTVYSSARDVRAQCKIRSYCSSVTISKSGRSMRRLALLPS
jgi:hypothetical protein